MSKNFYNIRKPGKNENSHTKNKQSKSNIYQPEKDYNDM